MTNMKRGLFTALLVLAVMSGCGGTQLLSMKPIEADIPELRFWYEKGGALKSVWGHAGDFFAAGDAKKFVVKLHKDAGKCQLTYDDGDSHFTKDCAGLSTMTLDLGKYYANHPDVIGISVATEKLGIQMGFFYPNLRAERDVLPVEYKCPGQSSNKTMSTCTRPASYQFFLNAQIEDGSAGEMQFVRKCNKTSMQTDVIPVTGAGPITVSLQSMTPDYCVIQLNLRQNKQADGTYTIKKQQNLFVRFYDEKYIPLPIPELTKQSDGNWKACAPESYEKYSVNGNDRGSWTQSKCYTVGGSKDTEIDVWDRSGRFSWNATPGRMMLGTKGTTPQGIEINGFYFYNQARPWVEDRIKAACGSNDLACAKKKHSELLKDPKMIRAMEAWDASLLYQGE
jgi:hypothetical protein